MFEILSCELRELIQEIKYICTIRYDFDFRLVVGKIRAPSFGIRSYRVYLPITTFGKDWFTRCNLYYTIRLWYWAEFRVIIQESVDLKGVVWDQLHHVKSESDCAICLIRFFRVMVLSSSNNS